jgi:hypothetical protein
MAKQNIFIHQQNKFEAEATQNIAASETPSTLAALCLIGIAEINQH